MYGISYDCPIGNLPISDTAKLKTTVDLAHYSTSHEGLKEFLISEGYDVDAMVAKKKKSEGYDVDAMVTKKKQELELRVWDEESLSTASDDSVASMNLDGKLYSILFRYIICMLMNMRL